MKRILITLLLLGLFEFTFAQSDFPKSIINFGIGGGSNYGIFGTKTVIGYKNSGLFVGLGIFGGLFAYEIGAQISSGWLYANYGYGVYGIQYYEGTNYKELMEGGILTMGGMINLNR